MPALPTPSSACRRRGQRATARGAGSAHPPLFKALQCSREIHGHFDKWNLQPGAPSDEDIVAAGIQASRGGKPHEFPQLPAQAVAFYRAANFPRHREADARWPAVAATALLDDKSRRRNAGSSGGGQEIPASLQPLHGADTPLSLAGGPARSRTETLAPARPAGIEDLAAARRRHAGTEAVTALAHELARLIGPLHGIPR